MFQTDVSSEVQIPAGISIEGEKSWWYVKKRLHMYWFHVVCEVAYEDDDTFSEIFFIDHIDHLLELNASPHYQIIEIDFVSPSYMNGDTHWKMEPLAEIQEGTAHDANEDYQVHIFLLKDGSRYIDNMRSESDEDNVVKTDSIFTLESI